MRRTGILLRAQVLNLLPLRERRAPGRRRRPAGVLSVLGAAAVLLLLCGYNVFTAKALAGAGEGERIPAYMVSVSSFAIVFLTLFRANGILFGGRDMDLLSSLPVKRGEVLGSKFLLLYLLNLLLAAAFLLPGGVIWQAAVQVEFLPLLLFGLSTLFVPLIPVCLASVAGVLILVAAARVRHRNLISLLLSFAALGLLGYLAVSGMGGPGELGAGLAGQLTGLYPLSGCFLRGSEGGVGMVLFQALSAAVLLLFMGLVAPRHSALNALAGAPARYPRREASFQRRSPLAALYGKELGRFFSSYLAVLNTGLGVALLWVFSGLLLLLPPERLGRYVGVEDVNGLLVQYAPLVVAAMLTLCCPAASSISLEGRQVWISRSAPVCVKTVLNSKIAVNLTLHALGYLPAVWALLARLDMTAWQGLSLVCIPLCHSLFTAVLGVWLNKKMPCFDWESEILVVKQSAPVVLAGLGGMAAVAAPALLHGGFSFPLGPLLWLNGGLLLAASGALYRRAGQARYL